MERLFREAMIDRVRISSAGLFLTLALAVPGAASVLVSGVARVEAPTGAATVLKVVASLPVIALPAVRGEPVTKGALLVELDVRSLERAVREARDRLAAEQEMSRGRSSARTATRANDSQMNQEENTAMSDLLELQTRISTASPQAPEDGYVTQNFYAVGAQAKRRKPLVSFVAATRTRVRIALEGDPASSFPPGTEVTVISSEDDALRFRCAVVLHSSLKTGGSELELRPLELPFLALERETAVVIVTAP